MHGQLSANKKTVIPYTEEDCKLIITIKFGISSHDPRGVLRLKTVFFKLELKLKPIFLKDILANFRLMFLLIW